MRTYVMIVGILLGVIGFVMLILPVYIDVGAKSYQCGSGFATDADKVQFADLMTRFNAGPYRDPGEGTAVERCDSATASRQGWAYPLLIGGALVAIGAGVAGAQSRKSAPKPSSDTAPA